MSRMRRYQVVLSVLIALFIYVMTTDVFGRLTGVCAQYKSLRQAQNELLDPSSLARLTKELTERRNVIASSLANSTVEFEQNETGVFHLLNRKANAAGLHIESLRPLDIERQGQIENIKFRVCLTSGFHEIGHYVNALETSHMPITINSIELALRSNYSSPIRADIEGVAHTLSKQTPW